MQENNNKPSEDFDENGEPEFDFPEQPLNEEMPISSPFPEESPLRATESESQEPSISDGSGYKSFASMILAFGILGAAIYAGITRSILVFFAVLINTLIWFAIFRGIGTNKESVSELVKAVNTQQKRIEDLENKLNSLK